MDLITIAKAGAATVAIAVAATYLLPRNVHVERTAMLDLAPAEVLALAASTKGFQQFNPYLTADPDLKITPFGPAKGPGAGFAFDGKDGQGTQTIREITDAHVIYDIDMGALGQPVQTITVAPEGNGTRVVWSVDSDLGLNPMFRVFGLFLDRVMGPTFETGLDNLSRIAA